MKDKLRFVVSVAAMLLVVAPMALAAPKEETATVGWFLKEIATARGLSAPTEAGAAQVLRAAGVAVPSLDPGKVLTERDAVAIGQSVGFTTTTRNPDATLSRTRAQSLLTTFQSEIAGSGEDGSARPNDAGGEPNENSNNGKGKKKGHNKSPSEPL